MILQALDCRIAGLGKMPGSFRLQGFGRMAHLEISY